MAILLMAELELISLDTELFKKTFKPAELTSLHLLIYASLNTWINMVKSNEFEP